MSDSHTHGLCATLAVMSLPDTLLSMSERWCFAVVVALSTTLLSKLVGYLLRKVGARE